MTEVYRVAGNCAEATEVLRRLPKELLQQSRLRMQIAFCHLAQGERDKAMRIYSEVVDTTPLYNAVAIAAELALSLGEVEEALDLMERAIEEKSWHQFFIRMRFSNNEALENHPRFIALLKRIGLDDESVTALNRKFPTD